MAATDGGHKNEGTSKTPLLVGSTGEKVGIGEPCALLTITLNECPHHQRLYDEGKQNQTVLKELLGDHLVFEKHVVVVLQTHARPEEIDHAIALLEQSIYHGSAWRHDWCLCEVR